MNRIIALSIIAFSWMTACQPRELVHKPSNTRNVEQSAKQENVSLEASLTALSFFSTYRTYDEIKTVLTDYATSSLASLINLSPNTVQGRTIQLMKITGAGSAQEIAARPSAVITCASHAREWLTPMFCAWLIDHLIRNYGSDAKVTRMVDQMVWHIVPIVNPDGYVHTWTSPSLEPYDHFTNARWWRKNRNGDGIDLNRNWGGPTYGTGVDGNAGSGNYSSSPSSILYKGPNAFSENETQAVKNYAETSVNNLELFIDYHVYGGYYSWPFMYNSKTHGLDDSDALINGKTYQGRSFTRKSELSQLHQGYIQAIAQGSQALNDTYTVREIENTQTEGYTSTGDAKDWFAWRFNAIAFLMEMAPVGTWDEHGFPGMHLDPAKIIEASMEQVAGLEYLADYLIRKYEPTLDFGGAYGYKEGGTPVNNPATGQQSCPAGYTDSIVYGTVNKDYPVHFCHRTRSPANQSLYDFGGMWGYVNGVSTINPLTGASSCPAGFTALQLLGTYNVDYPLYICYRSHQEDASLRFGGLIGTISGQSTTNPLSGTTSCPAGYFRQAVLGTYNVGGTTESCGFEFRRLAA